MDRRLVFAAALLLAGCLQPGNYNLNVAVGPPQGASASSAAASPAGASPAASTAPPASSAPGATSAASPTPPTTAPDLAQEQVATYQQVGLGTRLAQSFKPHRSGQLFAIGLRLSASHGADGNAAIVIRSVDADGKPQNTLGAATLHGSSLPPDGQTWTTATLDVSTPLGANTQYAFVLTYDGSFAIFCGSAPDSSYRDGTAFTGLTDGSTFWNKLSQDLAFRIYMK